MERNSMPERFEGDADNELIDCLAPHGRAKDQIEAILEGLSAWGIAQRLDGLAVAAAANRALVLFQEVKRNAVLDAQVRYDLLRELKDKGVLTQQQLEEEATIVANALHDKTKDD